MHRRPFVEAIADAMEDQLRANDHKGGKWNSLDELSAKLSEEVDELRQEAMHGNSTVKLLKEAADVANVAGMFVTYCCTDFPHFNHRPQP